MDHEDDRMRDELVLGHDDLDGDRRQRSERLLAADPTARQWLDRIHDVEDRARELAGLDTWSPADLCAEEEAAHDASLRKILERTRSSGVAGPANHRRASRRRFARILPWLPVAAAAVLLLYLVPLDLGTEDRLLSQVTVVSDGVDRATRSAGPVTGLVSGDAFALAFDLSADASVFVVHVDPSGALELVLAPTAFTTGSHRVPPAGEEWVLTPPVGRERFLLGVIAGSDSDDALLAGLLARESSETSDPATALIRVQTALSAFADDVRLVEVEHTR